MAHETVQNMGKTYQSHIEVIGNKMKTLLLIALEYKTLVT